MKKIITTLLSTIFLLGLSTQANAKDLYVSTTGDDSVTYENNNINHPWKTASKVNSSTFHPGDNIYFKRGDTWNERLLVPSSGDATGYIKFGAYGMGEKPTFDGTNLSLPMWQGLIHSQGHNYIIFDNLKAINVGIEHPTDPLSSYGLVLKTGDHLIIRYCEAFNTAHYGIHIAQSSNAVIAHNEVSHACMNTLSLAESLSVGEVDGFEISYNHVHHNGDDDHAGGGAGIDAKNGSHDGTVHHNEVHDIFGANHMYIDAWQQSTYNVEVYNNYLHDGHKGATGLTVSSEQGGLLRNIKVHHNVIARGMINGLSIHPGTRGAGSLDPVEDLFFYNNTIIDCGPDSPAFAGGFLIRNPDSKNIHIKNNVFSQNRVFQLGFSTLEVDETINRKQFHIDYNLMYGTINTASVAAVDGIAGTNSIQSDPLLVSATDFHLQSNSPAIDACDPTVWQGIANIKDFDGNPVTDEMGNVIGGMDCGAYNYTATTSNTKADVDDNSNINRTDAMLTLRNSVGLAMSGTDWKDSITTGDVNCNGSSNSTDAMLILRDVRGLEMSGTGWCVTSD